MEGVLEQLAEKLDKVDMTEEERARMKFEYTESVRSRHGRLTCYAQVTRRKPRNMPSKS